MEWIDKNDKYIREPLRCPECASLLDVRLVEVKDEAEDEGELLLLLDCPRNDFHTALTHQKLATVLGAEVTKRLAANR